MKEEIRLQDFIKEQLKDPEFKAAYEREGMSALPVTIAFKLAEARREKNITQEQLAAKAGLKQPYVSSFERGRQGAVKLSTLIKIAEALGVVIEFSVKSLPEVQEKNSGKRKAA